MYPEIEVIVYAKVPKLVMIRNAVNNFPTFESSSTVSKPTVEIVIIV